MDTSTATTHDTEIGIALGAMYFGTRQDEATSFGLLDRFVELGGCWIDTSDNYAFWVDPSGVGGASERVIGRWLAARPGMRERVLLSTKLGAAPTVAHAWPESMEGLGHDAIEAALNGSLTRLGTDRVDLLWAHVEDRDTPLEEQVTALGAVVADGRVRRLGASNHASWRVERARALATAAGLESYSAIQLRHTYLQPVPFAVIPDAGGHVVATADALDLARSEGMDLWAYSSLLGGAYARPDRPLPAPYVHSDTTARLEALDHVAAAIGSSRNQVVLAALIGGSPRCRPIVGVSSTAQLEEAATAHRVHLDAQARAVLNLPT